MLDVLPIRSYCPVVQAELFMPAAQLKISTTHTGRWTSTTLREGTTPARSRPSRTTDIWNSGPFPLPTVAENIVPMIQVSTM